MLETTLSSANLDPVGAFKRASTAFPMPVAAAHLPAEHDPCCIPASAWFYLKQWAVCVFRFYF